MKKSEIPYSLIAKLFTGQCNTEEENFLSGWRKEKPQHEELFQELKHEWDEMHRTVSQPVIPDKKKVWMKINAEILQKKKSIPVYTRKTLIRIASIAAGIALLFGISFTYFYNSPFNGLADSGQNSTIIVPSGQKSQLILADGTKVWLNAGSRLTYSNLYNTKERIVELDGEAFFEVIKDEKREFIVKTGMVDITVLGTSFNVNAYPEDSNISVSLLEGKVSVSSARDHRVLAYLEPNQGAVISRSDLICQVNSCDAETESIWRMNTLKFDGASAEEVSRKLERWYGVDITLENTKPDNHYWFTIKTESLTELLESINKLTPIEYKINGEEVTIRYK